mmetsp:Transcript_16197/g.61388  ORF Transcript_16197/g.61388 Transcript_16197/m.61388 type:complete len:261 (-) Transcript_16197:18-800(-)
MASHAQPLSPSKQTVQGSGEFAVAPAAAPSRGRRRSRKASHATARRWQRVAEASRARCGVQRLVGLGRNRPGGEVRGSNGQPHRDWRRRAPCRGRQHTDPRASGRRGQRERGGSPQPRGPPNGPRPARLPLRDAPPRRRGAGLGAGRQPGLREAGAVSRAIHGGPPLRALRRPAPRRAERPPSLARAGPRQGGRRPARGGGGAPAPGGARRHPVPGTTARRAARAVGVPALRGPRRRVGRRGRVQGSPRAPPRCARGDGP